MNQHLERLDGLAPLLRQPVLTLMQRCERKLGKKLLIVHGWRSVQEQQLIYQKGRTFDRATSEWVVSDPAAVVTRSRPGVSGHNVITTGGGRASVCVDVIPFDALGNPEWNVELDFWDALYELAWKVGLDPLGDPIGSYLAADLGHFEEPAWKLKLDGLGLVLPVALAPVGSMA